jgi:Tol biopolymer transport system component
MSDPAVSDRLDSWKEVAAYLNRDVTTVQRWEKRESMPVHRHVHDKLGSIYAFKSELDAWARNRRPVQAAAEVIEVEAEVKPPVASPQTGSARRRGLWIAVAAGVVVLTTVALWPPRRDARPDNALAEARFTPLTDFAGIEQAAAVSGDGRFVAFLSDRDGQMDVWVTPVGVGQFYNLTRGSIGELVNPSVRTLGFSPDGTLVTFWARRPDGSNQLAIGVWAVPVLGGQPRPYLEGAAEFDWSRDRGRVVYHTPGPGDPMYVRESGQSSARQIFSAPAGVHSHFMVWSPDQQFIYFVQGSVPDRMDIWRIPPTGGAPERMTHHDSRVSHPVFVNPRTLLYLASEPDGSGPWIYSLDVEQRMPRRVSVGIDRYTSLSASADGRRLVVTLASLKGTLWRLPIAAARAEPASDRRVPLTTGSGFSPRFGSDYLLYVSSKGSDDSIWKLQGDVASELWSAADARIIGAPAIARDGRRVAFSVRQRGESMLYVANVDGTAARIVTSALDLQGVPAWTPDGKAITVAATTNGVPRLFNVPRDGGSPTLLVDEHAVDPVWSPDGAFVVFSGPDIGTTFEVKAAKADGTAYPLPKLRLTRGARHVSFKSSRELVVLRGDIRHKNLWLIDVETGAERQLTDLAPEFVVRDFDMSADGREVVLEQMQEHSDIVLLEVPQR